VTLSLINRRRGERGNRIVSSEGIWLLSILAVGAFLRLFRVGHHSLWLDEAFSALLAQRDWGQIVSGTARDTMPPLYYLLLHPFLSLGSGETFLRLPSALWGIATIPLLYALGKDLFSEKAGLAGAGLLAGSPFHVFYSQEARMYSQLGFLSLLSAFCFWRAWQDRGKGYWLAFGLSTAAALYTHNMAILSLSALGVFALARWQRTRQKARSLAAALVGIGLLFLPWLLYLPDQIARVGGRFWVETPSALELLTTLGLFSFGYALPGPLIVVALTVALYAVFLTLFIAWRAWPGEGSGREALLFALCLFAVPLAVSFLVSLRWPVFLARTLMVSALAMLLLVGWGLTRTPRALVALLAVGGMALTGLSLYNFYANPAYAKPPLREAANYLAARFQNGDTVIHSSDSSYLAFAYYAPGLERHFLVGDPDYEGETTRGRTGRIAGIRPEGLAEVVSDRSRLWVVMVLDHNVAYQQQVNDLVDQRYPLISAADVGGIKVFLYDLKQSDASNLGERVQWARDP